MYVSDIANYNLIIIFERTYTIVHPLTPNSFLVLLNEYAWHRICLKIEMKCSPLYNWHFENSFESSIVIPSVSTLTRVKNSAFAFRSTEKLIIIVHKHVAWYGTYLNTEQNKIQQHEIVLSEYAHRFHSQQICIAI